jgi:hypothetical protein
VSFSERVEVINMSVAGIALKTNRPVEVGREHMLLVEGRDFRLELSAVAVWSKPRSPKRMVDGKPVPEYTAGLRFVEALPPETQRLIGTFKERRVDLRFRVKAKSTVLLDVDDPCEVKLIGRTGMLIRSERPLELGGIYSMEIFLPGHIPVRLSGRIASYLMDTRQSPIQYDLGVEFLDMSADDRERLYAFIESIAT